MSTVVVTAHVPDHLLCAGILYAEHSHRSASPTVEMRKELQEAEPLDHSPVQGFEAQQGPPDPAV